MLLLTLLFGKKRIWSSQFRCLHYLPQTFKRETYIFLLLIFRPFSSSVFCSHYLSCSKFAALHTSISEYVKWYDLWYQYHTWSSVLSGLRWCDLWYHTWPSEVRASSSFFSTIALSPAISSSCKWRSSSSPARRRLSCLVDSNSTWFCFNTDTYVREWGWISKEQVLSLVSEK